MITYLSRKLTGFLCRNSIIESDKAEIYQYGYEVFISGMLGFIISIVIGIISGHLIESLIFLVFFVPLRQLSGGYHADSYLICNIVFTAIFLSILAAACFISQRLTIPIAILCEIFTFLTMFFLAPIENKNKPLDEEQITLNRKKCLITVPLLSLLSFILFFFNSVYSLTAALTLFSIAILMLVTKFTKNSK